MACRALHSRALVFLGVDSTWSHRRESCRRRTTVEMSGRRTQQYWVRKSSLLAPLLAPVHPALFSLQIMLRCATHYMIPLKFRRTSTGISPARTQVHRRGTAGDDSLVPACLAIPATAARSMTCRLEWPRQCSPPRSDVALNKLSDPL